MLCQSHLWAPLGAGEEESTYCILTGCKSLQLGSKTSATLTEKSVGKGMERDLQGDSDTSPPVRPMPTPAPSLPGCWARGGSEKKLSGTGEADSCANLLPGRAWGAEEVAGQQGGTGAQGALWDSREETPLQLKVNFA